MDIIGAAAGAVSGIAGALWAIYCLKRHNDETYESDIHALRCVSETGAVDLEWAETIRRGTKTGQVSPTVAVAAADCCGLEQSDIDSASKTYFAWGGSASPVFGTGCSAKFIASACACCVVCGALSGATGGWIAGAWSALVAAIATFDWRYRRIDLAQVGLLAILGVATNGASFASIGLGLALLVGLWLLSAVSGIAMGKNAFGLGDVLLVAAIGCRLSLNSDAWSVFLAALVAVLLVMLLAMKRFDIDTLVPFAPIVMPAALIATFAGVVL